MLKYLYIFIILLSGCQQLNKITNGDTVSRDSIYDSRMPIFIPRTEPYAIFAGKHFEPDGSFENLYLVHWTGNVLNNQSLLESDVDQYGIPKYNS